MYIVTVSGSFAAAHQIKDYDGDCSNIHGHTWKVEAAFRGPRIDNKNMLIDFREVKDGLGDVLEAFDHTNINEWTGEPNVTAEWLAHTIWEELRAMFPKDVSRLAHSVTVWESENSSVTYVED